MSRHILKEETILHHFAFSDYPHLTKHDAYARYIIDLVNSGTLPAGTVIPSVKNLYENNDCSTHTINLSLKILQTKGYLLIVTGKKSVILHPKIKPIAVEKPIVQFHGNHQCLFSPVYTEKLNKNILKSIKEHQGRVPAGEQNSIFPELLYMLTLRFNLFHHKTFSQDRIYYMQDIHFLVMAVVNVIKEKNKGIVVVTRNCQVFIPAILRARGLKVIEISVETDGLSVIELEKIAQDYQIAAVICMSRANFPHGLNLSESKTKTLLKLCKSNGFKIIDINTAEPWLVSKTNLLLELAGDAMEFLIYVFRVTLVQYQTCGIYGIASHQDNISMIRKFAKAQGKRAVQSVAYAACQLMSTAEFNRIEEEMTRSIADMKAIAADLIIQSGFWQVDGIGTDNGDTVFLVPKSGGFPKDVFDQLIAENINAVDTKLYTQEGAEVAGVRFEMAHYAQNKAFARRFEAVLRICERLVH